MTETTETQAPEKEAHVFDPSKYNIVATPDYKGVASLYNAFNQVNAQLGALSEDEESGSSSAVKKEWLEDERLQGIARDMATYMAGVCSSAMDENTGLSALLENVFSELRQSARERRIVETRDVLLSRNEIDVTNVSALKHDARTLKDMTEKMYFLVSQMNANAKVPAELKSVIKDSKLTMDKIRGPKVNEFGQRTQRTPGETPPFKINGEVFVNPGSSALYWAVQEWSEKSMTTENFWKHLEKLGDKKSYGREVLNLQHPQTGKVLEIGILPSRQAQTESE